MLLESIQNRLHTIYDLGPGYPIADFLITCPKQITALDQSENPRSIEEKLLIYEDEGELHISLFINQSILDALHDCEPVSPLNQQKVATYCTALEGVSHFVYLSWNARHNRTISQLEMELQAEVDKFVSLLKLYEEQGVVISSEILANWLFDECGYDENLKPVERERYQRANSYASQFCRRLMWKKPRDRIDQTAFRELRRFYRKRHQDKLQHCDHHNILSGP
ncbi:MAG: hypothetical protein KTR18_10250 [Acidiferrobacterales bacterium]|nr:hypothetical protein [Acidiferrobacterales bacterium]